MVELRSVKGLDLGLSYLRAKSKCEGLQGLATQCETLKFDVVELASTELD